MDGKRNSNESNSHRTKGLIFHVTLSPNRVGRFFGRKPKTIRVKDACRRYFFGGGYVYYREDGSELGNLSEIGGAIDRWRRKF